jgi:hypothetical protein
LPVFLYVETNFPMSYATGRSPGANSILSDRPPSFQLIMPSVCFMEALSVFEAERKGHRRRLDSLGEQLHEVRRNVVSSLIPSLVNHLNQAQAKTDLLSKEFTLRLFEALEILGWNAELIHLTPEILLSSRANVLIEDSTDNLILASVLDHAKNYPSETKVFLSENRKDFDINTRAKRALRGPGVRYFADASKCLEWHRAQPDS